MKIAVIFLALLSCVSRASWSPSAIEIAQDFGAYPGPKIESMRLRSFRATLWAGFLRRGLISETIEDLLEDNIRELKLPQLCKNGLPYVFIPVKEKGKIKKAPLLVFIPGVFSGISDTAAKTIVQYFSGLGHHIVILPNPWSREFLKSKPRYLIKSPRFEAKLMSAILKAVDENIGQENIQFRHLMGESLGAFMAAAIFGIDSQRTSPKFEELSLFWPPLNLAKSMKNLDDMLANYNKKYRLSCRYRLLMPWVLFSEIKSGEILKKKDLLISGCEGAYVAELGFRRLLLKSAKLIERQKGLDIIPKKWRRQPGRRGGRGHGPSRLINPRYIKWKYKLNFKRFVTNFAPHFSHLKDENNQEADLRYWIRQARDNGQKKYRILSSKDDFINWGADFLVTWEEEFPADSLIQHDWGGHVGLSNHKNFFPLLNSQFRNSVLRD